MNSPITVVEFADLECPACRNLHAALRSMASRWPGQVSVVYRHFPLVGIHQYAQAGALANECAGAQGKFLEFQDAVYARQAELGSRPWTEFAKQSAVPQIPAFEQCLHDSTYSARVATDAAIADSLKFAGTPTIVIGDSAYFGPSPARLDSLVRGAARRGGIELR